GARRFTGSGGAGIPCGSMRSESSSASGADAHLSRRPGASRLDRAAGPVIAGTALFEQSKHVFCTVGRPDGKLPMPIQIERTAPVDGLEAIVSHGNSLRSAQHAALQLPPRRARQDSFKKRSCNQPSRWAVTPHQMNRGFITKAVGWNTVLDGGARSASVVRW